MGLDMYINSTNFKPESEVDFEVQEQDEVEVHEVAYFRKFNALHGWMQKLYEKKGGVDTDFNCTNLQLTQKDILQLIKDYNAGKLKPTNGFFFGAQEVADYDIEAMFTAIGKALVAIKNGETIYYSAWY